MKTKISKLQIFRTISQIIFLILLPGIFSLSFTQLGKLYNMIIKGNFNFISALPGFAVLFSVLLFTIVMGRFFCGWLCAFGTFNDFINIISKKLFKTKFNVNKQLDHILKYLKYAVLLFIVLFIWTTGSKIFNSVNPWNAFAQLTQLSKGLSSYFYGFVILTLIAAGDVLVERFFCRYLCPLGAVFSIVSKLRIFKLSRLKDECGNCKLCTKNCSMGINLKGSKIVKSGECINCFKCIEICPRKNVQANILDLKVDSKIASSAAIAAFIGIYSVSNVAAANLNKYIISENKSVVETSSNTSADGSSNNTAVSNQAGYKDGTYTGTGMGFRPDLQVSVTIKSGNIKSIEIININDTPGYYDEPLKIIPQEIIKAQSTNVDAVSGATRSSNGIMMAVEDALSKAK